MSYRLAATWKLLYRHVVEHQASLSRSGDPTGDLPHTEKLLLSIQQVLQNGEGEVTPRTAAAKLSAGSWEEDSATVKSDIFKPYFFALMEFFPENHIVLSSVTIHLLRIYYPG